MRESLIERGLLEGEGATCVVGTLQGDRLAAICFEQTIKVFEERDGILHKEGEWKVLGNGGPHCLALSPVEFGSVLAVGMEDGTICVWEKLPSASPSDESQKWKQRAALKDGKGLQICCIAFAPFEMGCILVVVYVKGLICMYRASDTLSAQSWSIASKFYVCLEDPFLKCNCMSFRPSSEDEPPILALGTNKGFQVWMYSPASMCWQLQHGEAGPSVSSIDWACNTGRPIEYIAVCTPETQAVDIWTIDEELNFSRNSSLKNTPIATQVSWDMIGSTLAARLADGRVALWRQNLLAQWKLIETIAAEDGSRMIP